MLAQHLAVLDVDAADGGDVVDFVLREAVRRLVERDPIFVEATGLGMGIKDGDGMAVHAEPMGAGEAGRAGADDRHLLAGLGAAAEELRALPHRRIGGVALQHADLDRLAFRRLAHAGFFAQLLGRADAGAHAAQDVLLENGLAAPSGLSVKISRMKSGMSIEVGQAVWQGAS